jgi:penicillin-binding protein 2
MIHDYALKFGLGKLTGINLPYEVNGFVPSPIWRKINQFKGWFDGDTANFAIGQGELLVTPIQMVRMMAVFANRGYLVTPHIAKSVAGRDFSVYYKRISKAPINKNVISYIREALKGVTNDPGGTANSLSNLSVTVAGKTGSAQNPRGAAHGWFVGFLPFDKPKYVICVFLEHGGSGYAASLVTKEIIIRMIEGNLI